MRRIALRLMRPTILLVIGARGNVRIHARVGGLGLVLSHRMLRNRPEFAPDARIKLTCEKSPAMGASVATSARSRHEACSAWTNC